MKCKFDVLSNVDYFLVNILVNIYFDEKRFFEIFVAKGEAG